MNGSNWEVGDGISTCMIMNEGRKEKAYFRKRHSKGDRRLID